MLVPSSYHCVGDAYYEKDFLMDDFSDKEVFLCIEGIAYEGNIWLNGKEIGSLLPYCRFKFDITQALVRGKNNITILIQDITAEYGSTNGWEDYGGITREVYLEIQDKVYIDDFQWITAFSNNYQASNCLVNVWMKRFIDSDVAGDLSIELKYNGELVYSETKK